MSHEFEDRALKDEEFDEYLRRSSEVSQRYQELGGREVPAALDAKVLRQAQQQAAKSSGRRRPWLRWGTPLALAATTLIAITVVMQPEVNAPGVPEPRVDAPLAESQKMVTSDYQADPAPQEEALAVFPESSRPAAEEDSALSDAVRTERAAEPKPAAATQQASQPGASGSARTRTDSSDARDLGLLDAGPEAAAVRERNVRQMPDSPPAPAEPDRPVEQLATPAQSERRQVMKAPEPVSQPALGGLAASAREESKAKREQEEEGARSNASPLVPAAPAPAPVVAAPPPQPAAGLLRAPAAGPPPPAPAREGVSTLEADRTIAPAAWVRWIRDFRAQGDQVRAAELLKRLRVAHPSFELPADIAPPPKQR